MLRKKVESECQQYQQVPLKLSTRLSLYYLDLRETQISSAPILLLSPSHHGR